MASLKKQISELQKKIKELTPSFKKAEKEYKAVSRIYHKLSNEIREAKNEIGELEKRLKYERISKKIGKGEVVHIRSFFERVKNGENFDNKTVVWSTKNGKSGVSINIHIQRFDYFKSRKLLPKAKDILLDQRIL